MYFRSLSVGVLVAPFANAQLGELTTYPIIGGYHEGIAYDEANNRLLLSSLVSNSIIALDPDNDYALLNTYVPDGGVNPSGLGLKVEASTGHVHATISSFATFDNGGYAKYDLQDDTGTAVLAETYNMTCTNNGTPSCGLANDVIVTDDGVAYLTDSSNGRIFKVENGAMGEVNISDPTLLDWVDASFPFGSNGLVMTEEGTLLVANSGAGTLVRIDPDTSEAMNVEIEGESGGGDGLLYANRRLYIITGTTMYILESDDDWMTATSLGSIDIDKSADGESAATGAFGPMDENGNPSVIYVTYVRFGDLFGADGPNEDPSTLGVVSLNGSTGSTSAPGTDATTTGGGTTEAAGDAATTTGATDAPVDTTETPTTAAPGSAEPDNSASGMDFGVKMFFVGLLALTVVHY